MKKIYIYEIFKLQDTCRTFLSKLRTFKDYAGHELEFKDMQDIVDTMFQPYRANKGFTGPVHKDINMENQNAD